MEITTGDQQAVAMPDDARIDGDPDQPVLWVLLHDPAWDLELEEGMPAEMIAGGWPVLADGDVGPFFLNELHRGAGEEASDPLGDPDPLGVALQLVMEGRAEVELFQLVMQDVPVHVAMNADGHPLVVRADDDRLCLLVATCEERRRESSPPEWEHADLGRLIALLGEDLDLLVNSVGPLPIRLDGDLVRQVPQVSPEQASAVIQRLFDEQAEARSTR